MKKFLLSSAVALIIFNANAFSQEEDAEETGVFKYQHTFGLTASSTSGSGVYYKTALSDIFQAKAAGFIYFNESSDNNSNYYYGNNDFFVYNFGVELQANLYKSRNTRFYALAGANYFYDREIYDQYYSGLPEYSADKNIAKTIRGGVGVGFEFVVWKHLSMNLDGSFNLYNTDTQTIPGNTTIQSSNGYERGGHIGGGIGIGYTF